MSKFSIDHIALSVKDATLSIAFYKKVFKLKEIPNTASTSKTRWLSFNDGRQLHLISRPKKEVKINKAVHFALNTPDLEPFIEHLIQMNIDYSDWPGTTAKDYIRKDGVKQVYFQDPDGYWIEVNDNCE